MCRFESRHAPLDDVPPANFLMDDAPLDNALPDKTPLANALPDDAPSDGTYPDNDQLVPHQCFLKAAVSPLVQGCCAGHWCHGVQDMSKITRR